MLDRVRRRWRRRVPVVPRAVGAVLPEVVPREIADILAAPGRLCCCGGGCRGGGWLFWLLCRCCVRLYSLVLTGEFCVVAGAFLVVAVLLFGYPADAAFARDKGRPSVRGALQNRTRDV